MHATGNGNEILEADGQQSSFTDSTGNGFDLINDNNAVTNGTGILNGDAVFNGSNKLSYTNGAIVAASSPITICGWVYGSNLLVMIRDYMTTQWSMVYRCQQHMLVSGGVPLSK
jgi:hypothetical protein